MSGVKAAVKEVKAALDAQDFKTVLKLCKPIFVAGESAGETKYALN
jgi:hypothetical protein